MRNIRGKEAMGRKTRGAKVQHILGNAKKAVKLEVINGQWPPRPCLGVGLYPILPDSGKLIKGLCT